MWILWMISLISLIVCAIFAYRMIVSSYEFLPSDQRFLWRTGKKKEEENTPVPLNTDYFKNINRKIHSLEDNTSFYHLQIAKLEERLNALELHIPAKNKFQPTPEKFEEENCDCYS